MTSRFTVFVDDNYHAQDDSYRYKLGEFDDCQSAMAACMKIVDEFFAANAGGTATELFAAYRHYGEDPFIVGADRSCPVYAWKYAEQRCPEIASSEA